MLGDQPSNRKKVCVQGLGFVGSAMAIAIANASSDKGERLYDVTGVDLPTVEGNRRVAAISKGELPFTNSDDLLKDALKEAFRAGNISATTNPDVYKEADVIIVDINLDIDYQPGGPTVPLDGFKNAVRTVGDLVKPGALVIVETTVPPGTCEKVVVPVLDEALAERGLPKGCVHVAHSYERVMPGKDYLASIIHYWRVYAGVNEEAGNHCEEFLSTIINTKDYPMTRLHSTTASETSKVLENSYRAAAIAFMEEWGRFAEAVGIDLFQVINAIRVRPTHSNMRQPGFGVGGYCLTKDPLFAQIAAKEYFGLSDVDFAFCKRAVEVNKEMPLVSVGKLNDYFQGDLKGKKIALFGVSYRQDVGDTRYSPSETFVKALQEKGARVDCHDPLVDYWHDLNRPIEQELHADRYDAAVFAVGHKEYKEMNVRQWLGEHTLLILDANDVLTDQQRSEFRAEGCHVVSIGRGELL